MKKLLLVGATSAALFTTSAMAADMPVKGPVYKAPAIVAPVYNWTGFYVGANAGAVWSRWPITDVDYGHTSAALISSDGTTTLTNTGFTGGFQAGYNWQWGSNMLLGLETDINYTDVRNSRTFTRLGPVPGLPLGYTLSDSVKSDWLWTVRPRIGVTFGNSLLYVTGGLAVADVSFTHSSVYPDCPGPPAGCPVSGSVSETKLGWTAGGGWEMAFSGPWSVKAEYLYVDLGSVSFADSQAAYGFPQFGDTHEAKLQEHIVRIGINYRLGAR